MSTRWSSKSKSQFCSMDMLYAWRVFGSAAAILYAFDNLCICCLSAQSKMFLDPDHADIWVVLTLLRIRRRCFWICLLYWYRSAMQYKYSTFFEVVNKFEILYECLLILSAKRKKLHSTTAQLPRLIWEHQHGSVPFSFTLLMMRYM